MSKLIDNEASRKASFGILEALKEAENVEVKKTVMYEGACTGCKSCEEPEGSNDPIPKEKKESLKEDEEDTFEELIPEEDEDVEKMYDVISYYDDKLKGIEDSITSNDWSVITDFAHNKLMNGSYVKIVNTVSGKEKVITPSTYQDEFNGEFTIKPEGLTDAEIKTEEIVSDDDAAVVEAEEKIVEGLKVLESANGAFLLKESSGYIVGKNYNEKTGIIEEAECYKTEKVARRVFDKISK